MTAWTYPKAPDQMNFYSGIDSAKCWNQFGSYSFPSNNGCKKGIEIRTLEKKLGKRFGSYQPTALGPSSCLSTSVRYAVSWGEKDTQYQYNVLYVILKSTIKIPGDSGYNNNYNSVRVRAGMRGRCGGVKKKYEIFTVYTHILYTKLVHGQSGCVPFRRTCIGCCCWICHRAVVCII